jgi:uncharacterized protein (DUF433 family)
LAEAAKAGKGNAGALADMGKGTVIMFPRWDFVPFHGKLADEATGPVPPAVDARTVNRHITYMNYRDIITIEPGKRSGKPCIRGLRITVYDVLEYLASGMSEAEILEDFPELTRDDIRACLAFAADRERCLSVVPAE